MASERDAAKGAAAEPESSDPELAGAMESATRAKIEYLKEQNRHAEATASAERGMLGRLFGGKDHAPTFIALTAMVLGFIAFAGVLFQMTDAQDEGARTFWWDVAQFILTFTGTALGFAVGKSSSN